MVTREQIYQMLREQIAKNSAGGMIVLEATPGRERVGLQGSGEGTDFFIMEVRPPIRYKTRTIAG